MLWLGLIAISAWAIWAVVKFQWVGLGIVLVLISACIWADVKFRQKLSDPIALFTLLLVIIGALQAWILYTTDETMRIADETNRAANRAYVYFSDVERIWIQTGFNFWLPIQNSGNLPATGAKALVMCQPFEPEKDEPEPGDP